MLRALSTLYTYLHCQKIYSGKSKNRRRDRNQKLYIEIHINSTWLQKIKTEPKIVPGYKPKTVIEVLITSTRLQKIKTEPKIAQG